MPQGYQLSANEFISPQNEELPLLVKVKAANGYKKDWAHHIDNVGYQPCTVQWSQRKKVPGTCIHCDKDIKARSRFIWDTLVVIGGIPLDKLMRMNWTSHQNLEKLLAALTISGEKPEETWLELSIAVHSQYKYKYYEFKVADEQSPQTQAAPTPPPQNAVPAFVNNAFDTDDETSGEEVTSESESPLTSTDELVLAEFAPKIFIPDKWDQKRLAGAFNTALKSKGIENEEHCLKVAQYVLDNFDQLREQYTS